MAIPRLTLYGGTGCTICEKVRAWAEELVEEFGLSIDYVNVRENPSLDALYGEDIPVLFLDEREIGRGGFSRSRLSELLEENL